MDNAHSKLFILFLFLGKFSSNYDSRNFLFQKIHLRYQNKESIAKYILFNMEFNNKNCLIFEQKYVRNITEH